MSKTLLAAFVIAFSATTAHAAGDQIAFGARTLSIPAPAGFEGTASSAPRYVAASQAYLPASAQLLDAYVPPSTAKALAAGKTVEVERYFQLQASRKMLGVAASQSDFAADNERTERGIAEALKNSDELAAKLTRQGNAAIKQQTHADPALSLSGMRYLGAFRHEPWALFFSAKTRIGGPGGEQDMIGSGAFALINYQPVSLFAFARYHDERDRRWAEQALSSWADAIHAANPDDPAVAAQVGLSAADKIKLFKLAGQIGGGLIGVLSVVYFRRRRDARAKQLP